MSGISLPYIVEPSTAIGLTNINPNEVLGNVSSASAIPIGITQTQLTALINPVSSAANGSMIQLNGVSTSYFAGDGSYQPFPVIPTPPPRGLIPICAQSGSSVAFLSFTSTSLSTSYSIYQFHMQSLIPTAGDTLLMQVSSNDGASWNTASYINNISGNTRGIALSTADVSPVGGLNGMVEYGPFGIAASNAAASGYTAYIRAGGVGASLVGGNLIGINTINAVRIIRDSGGNISGTVSLYALNPP